jgi:hypothetical protein
MAVKGSGLGAGPDGPRVDQVANTPVDPRSGKAKHPQTTFENKWGMKDMTTMSGISPAVPGTGPDASSPNPLDPEPQSKLLRRQPTEIKANPGTPVDGDGNGLDYGLGGKVLGEAILSGSTAFPASTKEAGGAAPAYSGRDSN